MFGLFIGIGAVFVGMARVALALIVFAVKVVIWLGGRFIDAVYALYLRLSARRGIEGYD